MSNATVLHLHIRYYILSIGIVPHAKFSKKTLIVDETHGTGKLPIFQSPLQSLPKEILSDGVTSFFIQTAFEHLLFFTVLKRSE